MKTFLALALFALAAWTFGPHLFSGELRIYGQAAPDPIVTHPQGRELPAPVYETAPAVFLPGSDSPIFPEPKARPRAPKPQETRLPPQDGAVRCLGPVCYHGSPTP